MTPQATGTQDTNCNETHLATTATATGAATATATARAVGDHNHIDRGAIGRGDVREGSLGSPNHRLRLNIAMSDFW